MKPERQKQGRETEKPESRRQQATAEPWEHLFLRRQRSWGTARYEGRGWEKTRISGKFPVSSILKMTKHVLERTWRGWGTTR